MRVAAVALAVGVGSVVGVGPGHGATALTTTRASVTSAGLQGTGDNYMGALSADGGVVAFTAEGPDLVAGDTNGQWDVLAHDQANGRTGLVSRSGSAQGNDSSFMSDEGVGQTVSANGRFVVFTSWASNLVPGHKTPPANVYIRDRVLNRTRLMSISTAGAIGNGSSGMPVISADGRFVVFTSWASNLVPGDTNKMADVFIRDRAKRLTRRISLPATGQGYKMSGIGPSAISANGRFVAFASKAQNLVPNDTNQVIDIFVRDRATNRTTRVSVSSSHIQADADCGGPSISADGRYVTFSSASDYLAGPDINPQSAVFIHDRATGQTRLVSRATGDTPGVGSSNSASISADGRYVAFESDAHNLSPEGVPECSSAT